MIEKCAAIIVKNRRLLVVRKRGTSTFISPGGKMEKAEGQLDCLRRELREELGVKLVQAERFGTYERRAEGEAHPIRIHAWLTSVDGVCLPHAEIEQLGWIAGAPLLPVGSVFAECVIPELVRRDLIDA